jgi:serine/threonine-protein kinase
MDVERWRLIGDLFGRAMGLSPDEQRAFVENQAGNDSQLVSRVLSMLEDDRNSSFVDAGAQAVAEDLFNHSLEDGFGPYRRVRLLGEGGMGVVYLADHAEWRTPVAIKVPRDLWISPHRKERFKAEQRALAQLTHPGIARIYEAGTGKNGTPWFAMEYVEGEPITVVAKSQNLTVENRLRLFRQACEAVQYAHSQAIIHRDLKPSNIFVTHSGQVKLLDFGIARQMEEMGTTATRTGYQPFTMAYAAPEQVSANRISVQSDIYSLGVTLYELLTGHVPFDLAGLTPLQAEQIISTKTPEKPSATSPLPLKRIEWADLDVLILKTLHKDVARRYRSVDALIRDLDHFLKQEPLDARPDAVCYRLGKFIQRHRIPVAVSIAILILIMSIVAYYTWRLTSARDEALEQAKREQRIQQFMTDLFEGGDQINGPSKDLRVVDMLAAGVTKAREFDSDPLLQADLYNTLGNVYDSIGEFDKADHLLQLALAHFTAARPPRPKKIAETLVNVSTVEDNDGEYSQADATIRKALDIVRQLEPADPVLVAHDELVLAGALFHETRYDEMLALLKSAEQIQSKRSEARTDWLANLNLQATANIQLNRYQEAGRLTRFLIEIDKQQHPVLRPEDADDIINLGQIEEAQRQFDKAEQSYREALRIEESWYPESHPEVANLRRLLAQALQEQGKNNEEATILARRAFSDLENTYGPWHARVAYALRTLCHLAFDRHDLKEARADATREIVIYRKAGQAENLRWHCPIWPI